MTVDTKFLEKVRDIGHTRPNEIAILQEIKNDALRTIEANALLSILSIIQLCTKYFEGTRYKKHLSPTQIIALLQRTGIEMSFKSLKMLECRIFKYCGYQVSQL